MEHARARFPGRVQLIFNLNLETMTKAYKVFTQKQMNTMFRGSKKRADKWLADNPGQDYSEADEYGCWYCGWPGCNGECQTKN